MCFSAILCYVYRNSQNEDAQMLYQTITKLQTEKSYDYKNSETAKFLYLKRSQTLTEK
jgi:hypothetical protein